MSVLRTVLKKVLHVRKEKVEAFEEKRKCEERTMEKRLSIDRHFFLVYDQVYSLLSFMNHYQDSSEGGSATRQGTDEPGSPLLDSIGLAGGRKLLLAET